MGSDNSRGGHVGVRYLPEPDLIAPSGKLLSECRVLIRVHRINAATSERSAGLRENAVPKDLEHFWMGHADEEIGDIYSQLETNVKFRREVPERIGLALTSRLKAPLLHPMHPKKSTKLQ
jgi:hypothetical protein